MIIIIIIIITITVLPNWPKEALSSREKALFQRTLEIINKKLRYPDQYDVDDPNEEEANFDEYRNELDKIILALTRVAPEDIIILMTSHYKELCDKMSNSTDTDAAVHWTVIESDLHIIYRLVEEFHLKSKKLIDEWLVESAPLRKFFELTIEAKIARTNAPKVITTYFDVKIFIFFVN
ncbi:hypothetical protein RFI_25233 [Reticulomyxa filosa]|uniref:Exportin-T n=1 Tax=Reticulomyxa filosa TaxID=46433 RepID=X6MDP7_RETFI|nr:hypothetical protein RFI_25233 [Reticulomyxa filosa]|eukprot:ETO12143.1 hypothetical protein RFI_25233 [Reticulomyxa filosa]